VRWSDYERVVPVEQRLGQPFDHYVGNVRRDPMQKTTIRGAVLAAVLAVAISVALVATLGAHARPTQAGSAAFAAGLRLAPEASWVHGKFQDPPAIAAQVASLNGALDECLTSHGAPRVSIAGGGWTYQDPNGAAQAACKSQGDAANAFSHGAEWAGLMQGTGPLFDAFWSCMDRTGVVPKNAPVDFDIYSPAVKAGEDACSAEANTAFASR